MKKIEIYIRETNIEEGSFIEKEDRLVKIAEIFDDELVGDGDVFISEVLNNKWPVIRDYYLKDRHTMPFVPVERRVYGKSKNY